MWSSAAEYQSLDKANVRKSRTDIALRAGHNSLDQDAGKGAKGDAKGKGKDVKGKAGSSFEALFPSIAFMMCSLKRCVWGGRQGGLWQGP